MTTHNFSPKAPRETRFILGPKGNPLLFVRLYVNKKRPRWEYVESKADASVFASERQAEQDAIEHRCPLFIIPKPYGLEITESGQTTESLSSCAKDGKELGATDRRGTDTPKRGGAHKRRCSFGEDFTNRSERNVKQIVFGDTGNGCED